jgi:UDP-N-acetylglucosamine--dolichyl-phosphate N-acetylglucosaminephosphotransferase
LFDLRSLGYLFAAALVAFFAVYFTTPRLIRRLKKEGLNGIDLHKVDRPMIPRMGGLAIMLGYVSGALLLLPVFSQIYVALTAILSSILMVAMLGIIDDVLDLSQATRTLLPLIASLPLTISVSQDRVMLFPIIGFVDLGLAYPLVVVPIGFVACANLTNMLAGFNGLEAGMGLIASAALFVSAILLGSTKGAIILSPMIGTLLAFLIYNRYPARIFPGNSGTYAIGATIAAAVIVGDMEVLGVICMTPFVVEFFLKAIGRFRGECFGVPASDGTLLPPERTASLTHLAMRLKRLKEKELVLWFLVVEAAFGSIAILVAHYNLYYFLFPA